MFTESLNLTLNFEKFRSSSVWLEHLTVNQGVAGSSPAGGALVEESRFYWDFFMPRPFVPIDFTTLSKGPFLQNNF